MEPIRDNRIGHMDYLPRGWRLYVEIRPYGRNKDWSNIIHATVKKDVGEGYRLPLINFQKRSSGLHICYDVNNDNNYCFDTDPLPMLNFSSVVVQQIQKSDGGYEFQIIINNILVHSTPNTNPQAFGDVWYYASDRWRDAAKATIKNFDVKTFVHKGKWYE